MAIPCWNTVSYGPTNGFNPVRASIVGSPRRQGTVKVPTKMRGEELAHLADSRWLTRAPGQDEEPRLCAQSDGELMMLQLTETYDEVGRLSYSRPIGRAGVANARPSSGHALAQLVWSWECARPIRRMF